MNLKEQIISGKRPFVIAGPCSAETEDQVHRICKEIAENKSATILRAGIWKPRTRPDSFEGIGETGLKWLVDAGKENNLPVTTEIANAKHAELALKAGVDVLWLGARTTVNPFAVQEIAEALAGVNIPIMIKNPVNPDIELWLGAFERFEKMGLTDLSAIHRGFSVYKHPKYRNVPSWEIPISLKVRRPDLPMICDPSHITGRRDLLLEVSQKAMDLNFDGLMIETHDDADNAWSDAAQQISPKVLDELLKKLVLRSKSVSLDVQSQLSEIREKIAGFDDRIFDLLTARLNISEEVGEFKRKNNITILQQEHWENVIKNRIDKHTDYNLTQVFIRQFMDAMHQESIRRQVKIMNK